MYAKKHLDVSMMYRYVSINTENDQKSFIKKIFNRLWTVY